MIFILDRCANSQEEPPVEGAYSLTIHSITQFPFATLEEVAKAYFSLSSDSFEIAKEMWTNKGTNHRVEDGKLTRDGSDISVWAIEVQSLDELVGLSKHTVIIKPCFFNHNYMGITIGKPPEQSEEVRNG